MSEPMPFGLQIAIINRAFVKRMDEKAAALGLTSVQLRVLGAISRREEAGETAIHQNDLERIEHVTHPAMTKMLQRLESKGFVRCVPDEADRRCKKVHCTPRSEGIHRLILQQDAEVMEELCAHFTQQQRQQLQTLAGLLLQNIDAT